MIGKFSDNVYKRDSQSLCGGFFAFSWYPIKKKKKNQIEPIRAAHFSSKDQNSENLLRPKIHDDGDVYFASVHDCLV